MKWNKNLVSNFYEFLDPLTWLTLRQASQLFNKGQL